MRYFERGVLFPLGMSQCLFLLPHILSNVRILLFPHFQYFWHLSSLLAGSVSTGNGSSADVFSPFTMLIPVPGTVFDLGTDTVDGLDTGCDCIDWYKVVALLLST